MKFKNYLLNEEKSYLGKKVGDVLTAMQDAQEDLPNLGARQLIRLAGDIVNQIRKILNDSWSGKSIKHLLELQRAGVAIQKAIDEKGDLKEILPAATQLIQKISGDLGVKVNNLEAPEQSMGTDINQNDFQLTGQGPNNQPNVPPDGQSSG